MVNRESVSVQATAAQVRTQTALAYLDVYFAGEALKLATQTEHHVHEELEAAKGRLSSAATNSQEVLALTSARGVAEPPTPRVRSDERSASPACASGNSDVQMVGTAAAQVTCSDAMIRASASGEQSAPANTRSAPVSGAA